jgi:hypothetical protein
LLEDWRGRLQKSIGIYQEILVEENRIIEGIVKRIFASTKRNAGESREKSKQKVRRGLSKGIKLGSYFRWWMSTTIILAPWSNL